MNKYSNLLNANANLLNLCGAMEKVMAGRDEMGYGEMAAAGANCFINCDVASAFLLHLLPTAGLVRHSRKKSQELATPSYITWSLWRRIGLQSALPLAPPPTAPQHSPINECMIKFSISEFTRNINHSFNSSTGWLN